MILTRSNLSAPAKFKRPYHLAASIVRQLEVDDAYITAIWHYCTNKCGQTMYYWPQPDGYPDTVEYWSQGMVHRIDFGLKVGNMYINGLHYDLTATFGANPSLTSVVDDLNNRLFYGEMSTKRQTLDSTPFERQALECCESKVPRSHSLSLNLASSGTKQDRKQ
ncbi:MAG: DUF1800 family protein [Fimbriimonadaceae bacterium]